MMSDGSPGDYNLADDLRFNLWSNPQQFVYNWIEKFCYYSRVLKTDTSKTEMFSIF